MTDIHTHIIPGIDDGSKNVGESRILMNMICAQGIDTVVCTPHFSVERDNIDLFLRQRTECLDKIIKSAPVKLVAGCEAKYSEMLVDYEQLDLLCIDNTDYLLIEMNHRGAWSKNYLDIIKELRDYRKIVPIMAHIERYEFSHSNLEVISNLIDCGCLIQMNTEAFLVEPQYALSLVSKGMVHVLGSDCHSIINRRPSFDDAKKLICERLGEDFYTVLSKNSDCIVNGKKIDEA